MRGNLFLNIENPIKYASEKERLAIAQASLSEVIQFYLDMGLRDIFAPTVDVLLRIGKVLGNGATQKKRVFITDVFSSVNMHKVIIGLYDLIPDNYEDFEPLYAVLRPLGMISSSLSLSLLKLLICFAYADGVLSDKFASDFESIFSENLMVDFFNSGLESVPSPTEQVTVNELQRELITFFQKDDQMLPLDEICKQFPTYTKSQIKSALDEMVEMGIFYGGDSIFMCMYALTPEGLSMRI